MKSIGKIFRTVSVVTVLCLLVVMLPATVHAAGSIKLGTIIGSVDGRVDISGHGFDHKRLVYIYMSPADVEVDEDYVKDLDVFQQVHARTTNADGEFSSYFEIPSRLADGEEAEDVHSGKYYIYVTEARKGKVKAKAELIIAGIARISHTKGSTGTEVRVEGANYEDDENITVYFDDRVVPIISGDTMTDARGEFDCTVEIPEGTVGEHNLVVKDASGHEGKIKFIMEPKITLIPAQVADWDTVTIKGAGFSERVYVDIYFDGVEQGLAGTTTDEYGSFTTAITILPRSPGDYYVKAEDEYKNWDEASLTISAGITVSPDTGNIGTVVTVTGTGFNVNASITVTYDADKEPIAKVTADSQGKFTATFAVPDGKYGSHSITATDGTSTADTVFTMESNRPAVPVLVAPEKGTKAQSQAIFDWEDVDDPSGVVYTLEVANNQGFTPESLVLQKTGLTESGYTLTEREHLESTKQDKPYYWRVKAIDGASNESEWAGPEPFNVGSTFAITGWVLYALIAVGGLLLLFIIGFLLMRRIA